MPTSCMWYESAALAHPYKKHHEDMKKKNLLLALLVGAPLSIMAQERLSLAPLPPMGWMTWNQFQGNINEQLIRETADAMVEGGYRDAGYEYIFIDDCWQGGRDNRNNLIPDPEKFPSGIKALTDYVHAKGMKLGIYSDAAQLTCAGYTASYGFEEQDARTFASWGIDYLKYDYCNAPNDSAEAHRRYKAMADALDKCGRKIMLGICEWGAHQPQYWAHQAGGSVYRTSGDVRDMWKDIVHQGGMGILDIINITAPLTAHAHRGCWFDMDMLVVGLYGKGGPSSDCGGTGCTDTEYRTQMSMWAMMASPLAMSCDLRSVNATSRNIMLNPEVIAIDQDSLEVPATRISHKDGIQLFLRPLSHGRHALAVLNTTEQPRQVKVDFKAIGLPGSYALRDVWMHRCVARHTRKWSGQVAAHEAQVFVLQQ